MEYYSENKSDIYAKGNIPFFVRILQSNGV